MLDLRYGLCGGCLAELRYRSSRDTGEPQPGVSTEKTEQVLSASPTASFEQEPTTGPLLSREARFALLADLGIEAKTDPGAQRIVHEVEWLLGNWSLASLGPTRPARLRSELRPMGSAADVLLSCLRSRTPAARRLLAEALLEEDEDAAPSIVSNSGVDALSVFEDKLLTLRDLATTLEGTESRGRPPSDLRANLILPLGQLFEREYRGDASKQRIRKGGVVALSLYECARNAFVEHVLRFAGIYCPADIERYFRRSRRRKNN